MSMVGSAVSEDSGERVEAFAAVCAEALDDLERDECDMLVIDIMPLGAIIVTTGLHLPPVGTVPNGLSSCSCRHKH
jgi:hypothetical protein